jgi:regulator of sigma E protease
MGILTQALGLLLSLSILVVLHEFGHFAFARLFKVRVEKFYLFFNPWFELIKFKKGDTEYGVGWVPLGGYVKISGMIDESMDKEQMKLPPQPYEFRSKSTWERLLIMVGGVLVNFILALVIYSAILFTWGKEYIPAPNVTYGFDYHEIAEGIGLQDGDKILKVNDVVIDNYVDIIPKLLIDDATHVTVDRNGNTMIIDVPETFTKDVIGNEVRGLLTLQVPFIVDSIIEDTPAEVAGFKKNDKILAVNEVATPYYHLFDAEKKKHLDEEIKVKVLRGTSEIIIPVTPDEEGMVGIGNKSLDNYFDIKVIKYGFLESIPAGINLGVETLTFYVKQMKLFFTKEGAKQLGGFGAIGGLFPKKWDWKVFWNMTAFISLVLAFMNILPIPALDGGHVAFLLYEMVTGRKPGDKFLEYAQVAGMVIILGLVLFANGNDIYRFFFK